MTHGNKIYRKTEIVGTSTASFEDAISRALARAQQSLRQVRWFEVTEQRGRIDEGRRSSRSRSRSGSSSRSTPDPGERPDCQDEQAASQGLVSFAVQTSKAMCRSIGRLSTSVYNRHFRPSQEPKIAYVKVDFRKQCAAGGGRGASEVLD